MVRNIAAYIICIIKCKSGVKNTKFYNFEHLILKNFRRIKSFPKSYKNNLLIDGNFKLIQDSRRDLKYNPSLKSYKQMF